MSKFCVNCRHSVQPPAGFDLKEYTKCMYSYPGQVDLVTGEPKRQRYQYCAVLRETQDEKCCGPDARFFEAKEVMVAA